jgi:DNA repair photolyase
VLIAPLMPGINDAPHQLEPLLNAVHDAGATYVSGVALHLRGEVKDVFMGWLSEQRPELVSRYRELYGRGAYAPRAERDRLAALVRPQAPPQAAPRWSGRWEEFPAPRLQTGEARHEPQQRLF